MYFNINLPWRDRATISYNSVINKEGNSHPLHVAYRVASWSTARHFGLNHLGLLAPGKQADIVLLSDDEALEERFKVTCFVGHDIRSLALAEHYFGASQDCEDSILVRVHRGTGAGISNG